MKRAARIIGKILGAWLAANVLVFVLDFPAVVLLGSSLEELGPNVIGLLILTLWVALAFWWLRPELRRANTATGGRTAWDGSHPQKPAE